MYFLVNYIKKNTILHKNSDIIYMKKLFLIIILIYTTAVSVSVGQQKSYIIPDIGSPGMNIYVEIIAPFDSLWLFGNESVVNDNSLYLTPSNSADKGKIHFSPLYVSWSGRLISAQTFINPNLKPTSWEWSKGIKVPLDLVKAGTIIGKYDFYVVQPFHIGNANASRGYTFGEGGQNGLGIRSPRGAMIIDSMISTLPNVYIVSTKDCDPNTDGNQGYLPFTLISVGRFVVPNISADAIGKNGGPGGGGGGGSYEDNLAIFTATAPYPTDNDFQGGDGFTGGGAGGINFPLNNSILLPEKGRIGIGGNGSGSLDNTKTTSYAGSSLNGVLGSYIMKNIYQSAGGGTGHPFGLSGREYDINETNNFGGYGGGSSETDNTPGGNGCYASSGKINDGRQHGNKYLTPLAGGSGGASGNPKNIQFRIRSGYGGGGGGAIAITAPIIKIDKITASGAEGGELDITEILFENSHKCNGGHGSGGAIILNGKTETTIGTAETREGSNTLNNAGYIRYSGINLNIPTSQSAVQYVAECTNTLNIISSKNVTNYLSGATNLSKDGQISIYYKSENANTWEKFTDVNDIDNNGKWSVPIQPSFWDQSTDTLYYFYTVKNIPTNDDANLYAANPKNILTQSAANVITLLSEITPDTTISWDLSFGSISACYNGEKRDSISLGQYKAEILKIELEGDYKDCFNFTSIPAADACPVLLDPNSFLYINTNYNVCDDNSLGTKDAYINVFIKQEIGRIILWKILLNYKVVQNFEPTPLNFGNISIENIPKDTTKRVTYLPTSSIANITNAWLKDGIDFSFNQNALLSNGSLSSTQRNKDILITCIAASVGLKTDTLYFIVDNTFCEDTIAIPIQANVTGGTLRDTLWANTVSTIAICGDSAIYKIVVPANPTLDFTGDEIIDTSITYIGNNVEAVVTNDIEFPAIIEYNNYNNQIIFKSIGRNLGDKKAFVTFYVNRKNGTAFEQTFEFDINVIIPVSISPSSFNFGTTGAVVDTAILTNIHSKNWNIASSKFIKNKYAFIKDFNTFVPAMSSDTAIFQFVSSADRSLDDTLEVIIAYPDCLDTLLIPITGELVERVSLSFSIPDYQNVDPRSTNFPISVNVKSINSDFEGGKIDTMNISFANSYSLFYPRRIEQSNNPNIKYSSSLLNDNIRALNIANVIIPALKANEEKLLFNIIGDVLLGSDTTMVIFFGNPDHNFTTDFEYEAMIFNMGSLTIEVCNEGGFRLLQSTDALSSTSVNPATTNTIDIKCKIREVGSYHLEIVDNTGNSTKLKEWTVTNLEKTEYTFTIDLTMFANGNYYLHLQNENEQAILKLIILR